jgi:hypothetical protein
MNGRDRWLRSMVAIDGCDQRSRSTVAINGRDRRPAVANNGRDPRPRKQPRRTHIRAWGCERRLRSTIAIDGCDLRDQRPRSTAATNGRNPRLRTTAAIHGRDQRPRFTAAINGCSQLLWSTAAINGCDPRLRSTAPINSRVRSSERTRARPLRSTAMINGCDQTSAPTAAAIYGAINTVASPFASNCDLARECAYRRRIRESFEHGAAEPQRSEGKKTRCRRRFALSFRAVIPGAKRHDISSLVDQTSVALWLRVSGRALVVADHVRAMR